MNCQACKFIVPYVAEYKCSCKEVLLCKFCLENHKNCKGIHNVEDLIVIEKDLHLLKLYLSLKEAKSKVVFHLKKMIIIMSNCAKLSINNLEIFEKKLLELMNLSLNERTHNDEIEQLQSKTLYIKNISPKIKENIENIFSDIYSMGNRPINEWGLIQKKRHLEKCYGYNVKWCKEIKFSNDLKYGFNCKINIGIFK